MKPPTLETIKDKYEADSILVNVVERRWRHGSLSADEGARMLGATSITEKERWEEFMNSNGAEPNPNDPNVNQAVDKAVKTLSGGKEPSNNPGGNKV